MIKINYNNKLLEFNENEVYTLNSLITFLEIKSDFNYNVKFSIEILPNYITNISELHIYNNNNKIIYNGEKCEFNINKHNCIILELNNKNIEIKFIIKELDYYFIDSFNIILITSKYDLIR
jgi:hypothetical protein